MTPYRTAAVDEVALADAAEVSAFARSTRLARLRAHSVVLVVVVATMVASLSAFVRVMTTGPHHMVARVEVPAYTPAQLVSCDASGACFAFVSCLDHSVAPGARCNYWTRNDAR